MTYGELKKKLKKGGCYLLREGSGHEVWKSPITGKMFTVGRHNAEEVKNGTYFSILKQAGLK